MKTKLIFIPILLLISISLFSQPLDSLSIHELLDKLPTMVNTENDFKILVIFVSALLTYILPFLSKWIPKIANISDVAQRVSVIVISLVIPLVLMLTFLKGNLSLNTILPYIVNTLLGAVFSMKVFYPATKGIGLPKTPK